MEEKKTVSGDFVSNANAKKQDDAKKSKPKNKKPGFFSKLGTKIKDVFSELKKVSWPTFGKVVKMTGIVLVVVVVFMILITAFDTGLSALVNLIK